MGGIVAYRGGEVVITAVEKLAAGHELLDGNSLFGVVFRFPDIEKILVA